MAQLSIRQDPTDYTSFFGKGIHLLTELFTSKLYIPPIRTNLVPRPRLIHLIRGGLQSNRWLTLVSAPLKFGKTTLMHAWLKEIDHPTAWLSLDETDNDLPRFLTNLSAALQLVTEQIGAPLLSAH